MRRVVVKTKFDEIGNYIMLENKHDVDAYSAIVSTGLESVLQRLVTSKVSPERWDHMLGREDPDGIMYGAIIRAQQKGTNPLFEAEPLMCQKLQCISDWVEAGATIIVNEMGGYCSLEDDYHTIISNEDFVFTKPDTVTINSPTRYINLENDPELEERTIEYLSSVDPNYSHICLLRNYNEKELIEIFEKFQDEHGEVVYVYTTGMDIPQMYEYSKAIIHSGLKKVEFEFSAGQSEEHEEVITFLENAGVIVTLIEE